MRRSSDDDYIHAPTIRRCLGGFGDAGEQSADATRRQSSLRVFFDGSWPLFRVCSLAPPLPTHRLICARRLQNPWVQAYIERLPNAHKCTDYVFRMQPVNAVSTSAAGPLSSLLPICLSGIHSHIQAGTWRRSCPRTRRDARARRGSTAVPFPNANLRFARYTEPGKEKGGSVDDFGRPTRRTNREWCRRGGGMGSRAALEQRRCRCRFAFAR